MIFVTCYGVPSCCQHYQHPLGGALRGRENIRQCTNGQCCESTADFCVIYDGTAPTVYQLVWIYFKWVCVRLDRWIRSNMWEWMKGSRNYCVWRWVHLRVWVYVGSRFTNYVTMNHMFVRSGEDGCEWLWMLLDFM